MTVVRPSALRVALIIALGLFAWLFGGELPPAHAANFTVMKTADTADGACDADCSLREAIIAANASPGADTITLPAGVYTLSDGALQITSDMTVNGAGAASTTIDGGGADGVFEAVSGGTIDVTITGMTIRNGGSVDQGGGIYAEGANLTLAGLVVIGNDADDGGGIYQHNGMLAVTDSSVSDNTAVATGGGIHLNSGALTLTNSTISGNTATTDGGGIWASPATGALILTNSTVSGNSAGNEGGGIMVSSAGGAFAAGLFNSTVAFNTADSDADGIGGGGGIANGGPAASFKNTIIARNADPGSPSAPDCAGPLDNQGHNLVQDPTCAISGTFITGQDPLLGPLADNGGPTMTHALLPGSPAIDAGDDAGCAATDQRGVARPQGAACDIGAFELGATPAVSPWGDTDCSGGVGIGDAQKIARNLISLAITQAQGCPQVGSEVTFGGEHRLWGDTDCSGGVAIGDAQKIGRSLIGLAITQEPGCPQVGDLG